MFKLVLPGLFLALAFAKADRPLLWELDELPGTRELTTRNDEQIYRLPDTVIPFEYDIYLDLYFAESEDRPFSYDGRENIIIQAIAQNVTEIVLHSNVDRINSMNLLLNGVSVPLATIPLTIEPQYHFLKIHLASPMVPYVNYTLALDYTSTMNEGPMKRGIWRGWYTDADGNERIYATTHFQPYNARQAFPCWDEPLFKAVFRLHLTAPRSYRGTFSNTGVESMRFTTVDRIQENFFPTPRMSSYLVTFLVSETFQVIAENTTFNPPIRIIGRSNTHGLADHALDLAVKMTIFFDNYFQIPYETLHENLLNDHVSSPDWASAGTENWGMVSYRELYMIIDSRETIMSIEHYAATLVSHELAHKWFGNLVTCYWWSNTWINEGFASYFGYIATNEMFPEYALHEHFNSRYLQTSLSFDSGTNTAPMNHDVNTPSQVTGHFGTISYSKGAAFLRMTADIITPETFRKACQYFLEQNEFEPTDQYDLYNAFAQAIEEDNSLNQYPLFNFTDYYRIWVNEPGYPILTVNINYDNGEMSLHQERFFLSATANPTGQIYPIPITYSTASSANFENLRPVYILTGERAVLEKRPGEEWVIFNNFQHGHYRVNYDDKTWDLISEALRNSQNSIHYLNRAQVADDVFALMRSGRMTHSKGFDILRFLRTETNYHVWTVAISGFTWLRNRLRHLPESQATIDAYILSTMEEVISAVGFEPVSGETPTVSLTRQEVLQFACNLGHKACQENSLTRFLALKQGTWINPRIRRNVYMTGLRQGIAEDFDFLLNRLLQSNFANDQLEMLRGLGATTSRELLLRYLNFTLTKDVRSHDKVNAFNYALLGNQENALTVLDFVKNNIDAIRVSYVEDSPANPVNAALSNLASYLNEDGLADYQTWLQSTQTNSLQYTSTLSAINSARANIAWGTANAELILSAARDSAVTVVTSLSMLIVMAFLAIVVSMSYLIKLAILPALLALATADFPFDIEELDILYRNDDSALSYRLPEDLDPIHYEVEVTPYFEVAPAGKEPFTFDGRVTLTIRAVVDNLNALILQENVRQITGLSLLHNGTGVPIALNQLNPFDRIREFHFLRINLADGVTLENGEVYILNIVYVGNINETPLSRGVFRGSYRDDNGTLHWYAATHLQPVNSRQAFPSFDEPGFKSTFDIIINRPAHYTETFSNMRIKESYPFGDRVKEIFYTTPRMSAYLISFHISEEFKVIAENNDEEKPYRIIARPDAANQGAYALHVGPPITAWLDNYFNISYYDMADGLKNDQIAVPDWASGATENWGLVSYRELRLLYEEGETNAVDKMSIGTITAHELAHKWFGNLITCRWWDNVWINEGFASYFEYFAMDAVDKDMELEAQFNIMYVQSALSSDSGINTRALQHTVNSPADVTGHFSGISYSKGASLLLMLKHFLGEDTFKRALYLFLEERKYEHAFPSDLYRAFDQAVSESNQETDVEIASFMQYWVDEPGYPIINVNVNMGTGVMTITQERFFLSPTATQTSQFWPLPLTYTTEGSPNWDDLTPRHLMTNQPYTIQKDPGHEWVIFNVQQKGIYRVNYDTHTWEHIADALKDDYNNIHYLNRAQIVDDVFALMRSEKITFVLGFRILEFLKLDTSYYSWYPAITGFNWLRNRFLHLPPVLEQFDAILFEYLENVIQAVGYDVQTGEPLTRTLNRFYVLSFACSIGHEGCVANAIEKYAAFRQGGSINPNIRRHVYCSGLNNGDYADWRALYDKRQSSNNQAASVQMLRGLGCSTNTQAVQEYLNMILNDDLVKAQDRVNAFTFLYMGSRDNAKVALQYVKQNVDAIRAGVILQTWFLNILSNLASYLDEEGLVDMEEWLRESNIPETSLGLNYVASARNNMQWGTERADLILTAARGTGSILVPSLTLLLTILLALMIK
ncbi:uncharacterized protein LOC128671405 [Plodia interpunctella]|uniref:uncharacterized protein LOC128671405 n=1 Tax=Plodia interpunctella TaxID=58824 RepID=UPI0023679E91|nr:uncharacterized protein LOC128671405 [Plodia interpunctella]